MANVLTSFLGHFHRKAAGRLPLPRAMGGSFGVDYDGRQLNWLSVLRFGGKALPIQPQDAGDLRLNPIVAICLNWIATSWPLAVPQVGRIEGAKFVPDTRRHPLLKALQRPHPAYSGKWLCWALNKDYWTRGNAYAQIIRVGGQVTELNWLPARYVTPQPDAGGHLARYDYTPNGKALPVAPEDMLHFRFGVDEDNPLLGECPLLSAFREIVTDNSSADYKAGLLKNGGVPPWLISPRAGKDGHGDVVMSPDEARTMTQMLQEFLAQKPGQGRFLPGAVDFHQMAFEPGKMGLEILQELPETRIPGLFQIPPVVLNLRAGLQQSTYNNVREAKSAAWHGCLIPTQDLFAEEIGNKCLEEGKVLAYDRSRVGELQPDQNEEREQARKDFEAGLITLEEARAAGGRQTDEAIRAELEKEREARQPAPAPGQDPKPTGGQKPAKAP